MEVLAESVAHLKLPCNMLPVSCSTAASPGSGTVCPECTSDHVVQLTGQSAPSTSTPVQSEQDITVRNCTFDQVDTPQHGYRGSKVNLRFFR